MRPASALAISALVLLAACAGPPVARQTLEGTGIPQLCDAYADSSNPLERQMLEVELATRNVVRCPAGRIGAATAARLGHPQFARAPVRGFGKPARRYRCADFADPVAAQRLFLLSGGPTRDIHGLDPDGDGLACGWGSRIARIAAQEAPPDRRGAGR